LSVRKFILFTFIALLTYQFVGFFTFVEIEHFLIRKQIKKAIKLSVPENQLIDFHFTVKESKKLKWLKPHEFELNGRLYDVVHKTKSRGIWYFHCIDDIQETKLFKKLNSAVAANLVSSSEQHPVHGWLKLMNEPMEPLSFFEFSLLGFELKTKKINHLFVNRYQSNDLAISAPPPEV
jgi:hypothetical protein